MLKKPESYNELVGEKRAWYKTVGKVYCFILKADVHFNSKGFYHLLWDGKGYARPQKERINRLVLLPLAIPVIRYATQITKYRKRYLDSNGKDIKYWKLNRVVGRQNTPVTVILKRIGTGKIAFHSTWKNK